MKDFTNKFYICYAWEDIADVQPIVDNIQYEIGAKIISRVNGPQNDRDKAFAEIENAEIFLLFISDASKKTELVKDSVTRAQNLNKNILPVIIGKSSWFSHMPPEFKFRTKPYIYADEESKAKLFAQLKACLGINVENGDAFGCIVHIVTDVAATVFRYGENLGVAEPEPKDYKIRLAKGEHILDFISLDDDSIKHSEIYTVESNDGEQFLKLPLGDLFRQKKAEEQKAAREAEIKRKLEEEQYEKNLRLQQKLEQQRKQQQIESERRQMELRLQREQEEIEQQRQLAQEKKKDRHKIGGCMIWFMVILGIAQPWTIPFSLIYVWYVKSRSDDDDDSDDSVSYQTEKKSFKSVDARHRAYSSNKASFPSEILSHRTQILDLYRQGKMFAAKKYFVDAYNCSWDEATGYLKRFIDTYV